MEHLISLYDYSVSGNCYKVRLLLSLLRIPYNRIEVNIKKDQSKSDSFLNDVTPTGRIPLLAIPKDYIHPLTKLSFSPTTTSINSSSSSNEDETKEKDEKDFIYLTESNAILNLFADGTPLLPSTPIERAKTLQWLFWEQNSHEPNISVSRWWITYLDKGEDPEYLNQIVLKNKQGYEALNIMEEHLVSNEFFVGNKFSIADIALYAYTHVAEEAFQILKVG
ncbi:14262_t:CDS:2 [Entrophospora sp. SA101]|nr:15231_t:CDS:2 [Entrophospora candida]CAH1766014.1 5934_t:CDS:2 [Entrophospora sp. SA101]CAJ0649421.1 14262_t:CDS:2 [Entrophospora sp. SA101]CAJ0842187.1 8989_t:CDS:2 [Entrophospora sp. SA101]